MENSHDAKKRLLSNISDDECENEVGRDESGFWQRKRKAWRRKRRHANPCCFGFACLIGLWSVLALATTLLSYFRLSYLLHDKYAQDYLSLYNNRYKSYTMAWDVTGWGVGVIYWAAAIY